MRRISCLAALCCFVALGVKAQYRLPSSSMWLKAYPVSGARVPFAYDGEGTEFRVAWGMDTAWNSGTNVQRGTNFIGSENINSGRISFQPSDSVGDDYILSSSQQRSLRSRINNIKRSGTTKVIINCDHEALNSSVYYGKPKNWYRMIKASVLYAQNQGLTVTSILPFNEPDYTAWGEGSQADFKEIARMIKEDPDLAGIRVCGGNTLNCDQALNWYNYMKPYIDEGNTHQLAGVMSTYTNFFTTVRKDGNHATADELHNTMEALVAVHYGMQTGIWWGYDGVARGDFCKASNGGHELGYGENRNAWAAGCVYRLPNGRVEAFLGVSERQANKNWMDFIATDRDVYYDGYGPVRLYQQFLPGDGVYQSSAQRNADKVIHIHSGEDVPLDTIGGIYQIMNKSTNRLISAASVSNRAAVQLSDRKGTDVEHWTLWPTSHLKGMDFSYHYIRQATNNYYMNLLNNSLNVNGTFVLYNANGADNEQYVFEYAGDGWYYMKNHMSGLYVQSYGNTNIIQNTFTGNDNQKWRLIPVEAKLEQEAPSAPIGLKTEGRSASVLLTWDANTESDMSSYMIFRSYYDGGETKWETIGRRIEGTSFLDNSCEQGKTYKYKIKALDLSGNRSEASSEVEGSTNSEKCMVARYEFDGSLEDQTNNQFDVAMSSEANYASTSILVRSGTHSLNLDGKNYAMIPNQLGNMKEMSISFWVYNSDSSRKNEHIFDFGSDSNHCIYFTPISSVNDAQLVLKNGDEKQVLSLESIRIGWKYVTVTFSEESVKVYVNGEEMASSAITIRPSDIKPAVCYIALSQTVSDPLFKGRLDDLRIYNYAILPEEIHEIMGVYSGIESIDGNATVVSTEYYNLNGERIVRPERGVNIIKQKMSDGKVKVEKVIVD